MTAAGVLSPELDTCIVVPCFDEAERLRPGAFASFVERNGCVGFLFVDDGSTDATSELLQQMCSTDPGRMTMLTLPENRGKAEAVRQGISTALDRPETRYIGYWDADLATPLDEIDLLRDVLERRGSIDIALGIRLPLLGRRVRRGRLRTLLGSMFSSAMSARFGRRFRDTQCGAKLFRVTAGLRAAVREPFASAWIFDVELLARCRSVDGPVGDRFQGVHEHPLENWTARGASKVNLRALGRALRDAPYVWYRASGERRN